MDRHVVGSVAGQPVDLVDDAVVRLVLGDVLDHRISSGRSDLWRGFARVDELLDDRCAELVGLALVRLALAQGSREALAWPPFSACSLRGDPQVRDGE